MTRLTVALLGTPEILHDGQAVTLPTRKALALLIYLMVEGGLHSREKLTALFWPESDALRGRSMLRKTVLYLRQGLREEDYPDDARHLIVENTALGVKNVDVDLDLHHLEKAWMLARTTPSSPSTERFPATELAEAVRHYRGDFLEGFTLSDTLNFDNWMAVQREAWLRRLQLVFDRLTQWQLDSGDRSGAVETAARWVARAPLNEMAHRKLMQGYFDSGDVVAALQAYAACRAILERELNAIPTPETEALAERARQRNIGASPGAAGEAPSRHAAFEGPLLGRAAEHLALVTAYRKARRGYPQLVMIMGEPGIGKTRLAREFLKWAVAQGADVLQGQTIATIDHVSYQALISALRKRIEEENAPEDLLDDVWLAELGRLLPELRERYPDLPTSAAIAETEVPSRIFEATAQLGQALAKRMPLVLFLDDLQWADGASLDAFHYALRQWTEHHVPILFIGCVRVDELTTTSALLDWLGKLTKTLPVQYLHLGALSKEDTLRLAHALIDEDKNDEFGLWLAGETGGHPLFIVETLKSLAERGVLVEAEHGRWLIGDSTGLKRQPEELVPRGIQDVIRSRLARVSARGKMLLTAGAVLCPELDFGALCEVAGLNEEHGLLALEEVLSRRLFMEVGGKYQFTHDKVCELIYADTSAARRQVFHRRALEVRARLSAAPSELAYHARKAGLDERTFYWSIVAGTAAMQLFAVHDAIAHYEHAWQIWQQAGEARSRLPVDPALGIDQFLSQFGRAYELNGNLDKARTVYQEMLTFARESQKAKTECLALNRLATLFAQNWYDFAEAKSLLHQALGVARQNDDPIGVAETEWNLAQTEYYATHYDEASKHGRQALALARDLGAADLVARSLNIIAYISAMQGNWAQCEIEAGEAQSGYSKLGNRAMEADCLALIADAKIETGHSQAGVEAARTALTISQEIDNPWGQANIMTILAQGLLDTGFLYEALDNAQQGLAIARSNDLNRLLIQSLLALGEVYGNLLDLNAASSVYLEAMELREASRRQPFWQMLLGGLCGIYVLAEDWTNASKYAHWAVTSRTEGSPTYRGHNRWLQVEALVHGGDIELARTAVQQLARGAGTNQRYHLCYLRACTLLAQAGGDTGRAIAYLNEAEMLAHGLQLLNEVWTIESTISKLHFSQGKTEEAVQYRTRARNVIQRLADKIPDEHSRISFLEKATRRLP